MTDLTILVVGKNIQELQKSIDDQLSTVGVQTNLSSPYRDQTVLQIVLGAATGAIIKAVFDLIKGYIDTRKGSSKEPLAKNEIAVKVGDLTVTVKSDADTEELNRIFRAAIDASEQKA
jgi:hypothetical protein